MWRIYDHCTGIGCNLLFQFFQIWLESLCIRRDFHKLTVIVTYICTVFQKVRCKNDHFLAWIQYRLEDDIQTAGSTNCHDQIMCRKSCPETAVQRLRDRFSDILKACVAHISVENSRFFVVYKIYDCLAYTIRCWNTWVTKAEVIDFVCTILCPETISFFEHHTNC